MKIREYSQRKLDSCDLEVSSSQARRILIVCTLLFMVNCMDRQVLSAVLEPMRLDLGLSDTQVGAIQSGFLLAIALLAFPTSYLVDRWSRRKAISLMAIIWSVFTFVTGLGRSFLEVILPRIIVGAGEGGFSSGGTAMIAAVYPFKDRAKAIGIFNAAIPLGAGLGVIMGGYLSVHFGGWRTPFFVFAIPGIILGILALTLKDYKTVKSVDKSGRSQGIISSGISLFKIPTLRWVYFSNAMMSTSAYSFLTWGPAYAMRTQGIDEEKAGLLIGLFSLMAIIGAPLGGFLADAWNRRNPKGRLYMSALSLVAMTFFFVLTVYFDLQGPGLILGYILGVVLVLPASTYGTITQDVVTPDRKGMAFGMNTFSMYIFGGGWAPVVIGYVSDLMGGGASGLKWALMIAGCGGVVAAAAMLMASRHYIEDLHKVASFSLQGEHG